MLNLKLYYWCEHQQPLQKYWIEEKKLFIHFTQKYNNEIIFIRNVTHFEMITVHFSF